MSGARSCPDRRRRPHRARAGGRSWLARRVVHADREDRRRGRASEDGPHRRAHDGILPALGHRRLGARRAVSRRLSAGLCLAHVAHRLSSSGASRFPARAQSSPAAAEPAEARARAAGHVRSDHQAVRDLVRRTSICSTIPSWYRSRRCPTTCVATVRDVASGTTRTIEADYLIGTDGGASTVRETLGIRDERHPALTYTTNVIFRCPDFASLHDKGWAIASSSSGRKAPGSPSWRSTAATASACRSSARRTRSITARPISARRCGARWASDFDYEILSVLRWVRRELVADSYGTRARVPRGRCGAPDVADRRARHEQRHAGRRRSRLEARCGDPRLGRAEPAGELRDRAQAGGGAQHQGLDRKSRSACWRRAPRTSRRRKCSRTGPAGDAARKAYGEWYTELMSHEWFMNGYHLGYRYDDSPIVWPDGTPAPPLEGKTYTQIARPGARAPHVWLRGRALDARSLRPRVSCCCGSGRMRRRARGCSRRRPSAGVPLEVVRAGGAGCARGLRAAAGAGAAGWPCRLARRRRAARLPRAVIDCVRGARRLSAVASGLRLRRDCVRVGARRGSSMKHDPQHAAVLFRAWATELFARLGADRAVDVGRSRSRNSSRRCGASPTPSARSMPRTTWCRRSRPSGAT